MARMGRPRTFDRDVAITQAMHLFWEHGYDATSLSQLKAGIGGGITAPSFYAAFGSKQALFSEVMARYLATHGRVTDSLFDTSLPPAEAIELALRRSARMQCEPDHPKGCLVALGLMSTCSQESTLISRPLAQARDRTRAGLLACVERAIASGELASSVSAQALATVFDSFLLGLSTLVRDGVAHATLDAAVTHIMGLWHSALATKEDLKIHPPMEHQPG